MAAWLSSVAIEDRVVMCTIARGEILFGLGRLAPGRRRAEPEAKAQKLFDALPCQPIPPAAGDLYANVKMANNVVGYRWMRTTNGWRQLPSPSTRTLVSRDS